MVTEGDKRPMKSLALSLFGVLLFLALSLSLAVIPAAATSREEEDHHHEIDSLDIAFSLSPRFPVVGEEAELTFRVSHDGTPEEGRRVMLMVAEAKEEGHNHHHGAEADAEENKAETTVIMATEISPGIYAIKHTFERGGKYTVTAQIGEASEEFAVAVRSRPVAWSLVIVLVALTAGVAGAVAVRKTVKREW